MGDTAPAGLPKNGSSSMPTLHTKSFGRGNRERQLTSHVCTSLSKKPSSVQTPSHSYPSLNWVVDRLADWKKSERPARGPDNRAGYSGESEKGATRRFSRPTVTIRLAGGAEDLRRDPKREASGLPVSFRSTSELLLMRQKTAE